MCLSYTSQYLWHSTCSLRRLLLKEYPAKVALSSYYEKYSFWCQSIGTFAMLMMVDYIPNVHKLPFLYTLSEVQFFFPSLLPKLCSSSSAVSLEDRQLHTTVMTIVTA